MEITSGSGLGQFLVAARQTVVARRPGDLGDLRADHRPCCIVEVGDEVKHASYNREHRQEYRRKVQLCLDMFETMLAQSSFEFDRPMTGMEIECNLVDADYQPAMTNQEVLAAIADPAYQTGGRLQHRIQRPAATAARPRR